MDALSTSTWLNDTVKNGSTNDSAPASRSPEELEFERIVRIIVPTVFALIAVTGFIGNLLVILVVASNHHMRSTTNVLILMLALADLFFIIICVPFTALAIVLPRWPFGLYWCRIYQYSINVTVYAGVYTLVLMSFVRYLAIVHPLNSISRMFRRKPYVIGAIVALWSTIIGSNVPILFEYGVLEYRFYGEIRSACFNMKFLTQENHGKVFYGCFFAFGFALPLTVICILYGLLLRRLLRGFTSTRHSMNGAQSTENPRSKRRITRMLVIIVAIFALCWLPLQVITLMRHLGFDSDSIPFLALQLGSNCLAYMNSCVNPVLYAFLSRSFRDSFYNVICCSNSLQRRSSTRRKKHLVYYSTTRQHSYTCTVSD